MGRNVLLLYMSIFNKNPKIQTQTQTNEGAVRYLIEEGRPRTAFWHCAARGCAKKRKRCRTAAPAPRWNTSGIAFAQGAHPGRTAGGDRGAGQHGRRNTVSGYLAAAGKDRDRGHPFVDLSGGLRDVAMLLVIAARCMRDLRKVQTRRVIYAELRGGESIVRDRTQLYGLFDFVTAMDQFFSTGTAQKLENYLLSEGEKDPVLHTLLTRINQFSEDLALCRVRKLNDDLNQIDQALKETPEKSQNLTDLFFRMLKDRFSTEFAETAFLRRKGAACTGELVRRPRDVPAGADPVVRADAGICLPASLCAAHPPKAGTIWQRRCRTRASRGCTRCSTSTSAG